MKQSELWYDAVIIKQNKWENGIKDMDGHGLMKPVDVVDNDSYHPTLVVVACLRRWIRRFRDRRAFQKEYFSITRRLSRWAPAARPRMGYGYL